ERLLWELKDAGADRIRYVGDAFRRKMTVAEVHQLTGIDPWFLIQIEDIIKDETVLAGMTLSQVDRKHMFGLKRKGFSDIRLAKVLGATETAVRELRHGMDIRPVYKRVDTCAAEFRSQTAYMYSCYE